MADVELLLELRRTPPRYAAVGRTDAPWPNFLRTAAAVEDADEDTNRPRDAMIPTKAGADAHLISPSSDHEKPKSPITTSPAKMMMLGRFRDVIDLLGRLSHCQSLRNCFLLKVECCRAKIRSELQKRSPTACASSDCGGRCQASSC